MKILRRSRSILATLSVAAGFAVLVLALGGLLACGGEEVAAGNEIEYWTCPMHPDVHEHEEGPCPICGMDLHPVHADHDEHDHEVLDPEAPSPERPTSFRVAPVQQQLIGVKTDTVEHRVLERRVRTTGRVREDERRVTEVTVRVMGYVERTHVQETGVRVRRGQPLVTIYSPELVAAQEEYLITLRSGQAQLAERGRERLRLLGMPEPEIGRLDEERRALLEVTLPAPRAGVVRKMTVRDGMQVTPGMLLYEIVDLSRVWLLADVFEEDLGLVEVGQEVEVELQGFAGERLGGRVSFVPPDVDPATRSAPVRIELPNPDGRIRLGQYGWVAFVHDLGEPLAIPREAVLMTGGRSVVFRQIGDGRFEPVDVHLGPLADGHYPVLHGLAEGESIATSGRFFLDAEARLRGIGVEAPPPELHVH